MPPPDATVRTAARNAVLPIPAGPSTTTNRPRPSSASESAASIRTSSSLRSSSASPPMRLGCPPVGDAVAADSEDVS